MLYPDLPLLLLLTIADQVLKLRESAILLCFRRLSQLVNYIAATGILPTIYTSCTVSRILR
jgi:hypothetical protein